MKMTKRDFIEMMMNNSVDDEITISDSLYQRIILHQVIKAEILDYIKSNYKPEENIRYKLEEIAYNLDRSIEQVCYYVIELSNEGQFIYEDEKTNSYNLYYAICRLFENLGVNEIPADEICKHFKVSISKIRNTINFVGGIDNGFLEYSADWNNETCSYKDKTGRKKFTIYYYRKKRG